jgi:hypothetical protein
MSTLAERLTALGKYIMTSHPPWPAISAAAAAGNFAQENLAKTVTTGVKDHGSDGLAQWRLDRLEGTLPNGRMGLKTWCEHMGYDWTLMESQVMFMKYEIQNYYPALWAQMVNPGDRPLKNLVANFQDMYEIPAPAYANLDNRIAEAQATLALIAQAPAPAPAPAPEPTPIPPPIATVPAVPTTDDLSSASIAVKVAQQAYLQAQVAVSATQTALKRAQENYDAASAQAAKAKQTVTDAVTKLKDLATSIGSNL